jgi:hypothetical protein
MTDGRRAPSKLLAQCRGWHTSSRLTLVRGLLYRFSRLSAAVHLVRRLSSAPGWPMNRTKSGTLQDHIDWLVIGALQGEFNKLRT